MSSLSEKVESFLKERENTIFSLNTIARNVSGKRRHVLYVITHNKNIRKCKPSEVGNYSVSLNIFKYDSKASDL